MRLINVLFCTVILFTAICAGGAGDRSAVLLMSGALYGQEIQKPLLTPSQDAEQTTDQSKTLYQVMGVVLFIWIGLALFLFRLDRRVARLERQIRIDK